MLGLAKQSTVDALQSKLARLEAALRSQDKGQEVTLSMIEFLLPALVKEIGADASEVTTVGRTKVATVGNVHVTIDGFSRRTELCANGNTTHHVAPLTLEFGPDGKLSASQMRNFRGFLSEVAAPVESSPFWDGTQQAAA